MEVLNYIIGLPNSTVQVEMPEEEVPANLGKAMSEHVRFNENDEESDAHSDEELGKDEKMTAYTAFENDMEKLFKSVEVEHEMLRMKASEKPDVRKKVNTNSARK